MHRTAAGRIVIPSYSLRAGAHRMILRYVAYGYINHAVRRTEAVNAPILSISQDRTPVLEDQLQGKRCFFLAKQRSPFATIISYLIRREIMYIGFRLDFRASPAPLRCSQQHSRQYEQVKSRHVTFPTSSRHLRKWKKCGSRKTSEG